MTTDGLEGNKAMVRLLVDRVINQWRMDELASVLEDEAARKARDVWVPETRSRSCGPFVFVDKPAEDVASRHPPWQVLMLLREMSRGGRIHVQRPVGPMTVIVREVISQDGLEMASSEDEHAIKALFGQR
jgi:hypothetical protein